MNQEQINKTQAFQSIKHISTLFKESKLKTVLSKEVYDKLFMAIYRSNKEISKSIEKDIAEKHVKENKLFTYVKL